MRIINGGGRGVRTLAALALGSGLMAVSAPASQAAGPDVMPMACPEMGQVTWSVSPSATYKGDPDSRTYGQSGGSLIISIGESVTTGGSITGTTSADAGIVFAKASVSVGVTVKKDWTNTTTKSYQWKVPSTQPTGWVELGHRAYNVSYTKSTIVAPCNVSKKTGKILGNTSNIMFIHS